MSLRARLAIAFALTATIIAVTMGALGYGATARQLTQEVDRSLLASGQRADMGMQPGRGTPPGREDALTYVSADGRVVVPADSIALPVTQSDIGAATSDERSVAARTQDVEGDPYRIVTVGLGDERGAVLRARDWSENAAVLRQLAVIISLSALVLAVAAAIAGWFLAGFITRRLVRLSATAEHVSRTGQLDVTVPGEGNDEVGRLAVGFNSMLGRLATAQADQQRLVQDAGHELRTPLTSLRTNISLLERFEELPPDVRARVLADLRGESRELTGLVNEVLELAGGAATYAERGPVRLRDVVTRVRDRAQRRTGRDIRLHADDSTVLASEAALERAVWNLVDNATKFDPTDNPIDIDVSAAVIAVSDRGPGIPPAEAKAIFERFYRPVSSRSMPGSGLGLSIVRDIARAHGGEATWGPRPGGGSIFTIDLRSVARPA